MDKISVHRSHISPKRAKARGWTRPLWLRKELEDLKGMREASKIRG